MIFQQETVQYKSGHQQWPCYAEGLLAFDLQKMWMQIIWNILHNMKYIIMAVVHLHNVFIHTIEPWNK